MGEVQGSVGLTMMFTKLVLTKLVVRRGSRYFPRWAIDVCQRDTPLHVRGALAPLNASALSMAHVGAEGGHAVAANGHVGGVSEAQAIEVAEEEEEEEEEEDDGKDEDEEVWKQ